MTEGQIPSLLEKKDIAIEQISKQIEEGETIRKITIQSDRELKNARAVFYSWDEYNSTLVQKLFDNSKFHEEYKRADRSIRAGPNSFSDKVAMFREDVQRKVRILGSILYRTEKLIEEKQETGRTVKHSGVAKDTLFIAMPMSDEYPELPDVLNAIKVAALECGLKPLRIDDEMSKDPITPRVLKKLQTAEFVVADLTHGRPNVYYEAGFAEALGNTPIYIARTGTNIEFDTQDYPVNFFENTEELTEKLNKLLTALKKQNEL